jgi:hypothetical protein
MRWPKTKAWVRGSRTCMELKTTEWLVLNHCSNFFIRTEIGTCYCETNTLWLFPECSSTLNITLCVSNLSVTVTNTWDNQHVRRKVLFWFTVSEVSVHGPLALLLWACGGSVHHSKTTRWKTFVHFMVAGKEREEEVGVPISLSNTYPPIT